MAAPRRRIGPRGNLGRRLRAAREALGLTQEQAAEVLGVARTTVARWETGAHRPTGPGLRFVQQWIAQALGEGGTDGT